MWFDKGSFHKKQQKTASVCHHVCHMLLSLTPGRNQHVIYHTDKQLSNKTGTLGLIVDLCVRLSLANDGLVCEISKSLSINYCLQLCSMMNVCCFNLEGYIHKVSVGNGI